MWRDRRDHYNSFFIIIFSLFNEFYPIFLSSSYIWLGEECHLVNVGERDAHMGLNFLCSCTGADLGLGSRIFSTFFSGRPN